MFELTDTKKTLESHALIDIGEEKPLIDHIVRIAPDAILHLAAQPLVLPAYDAPVDTFRTNVLGTVHVLEAARTCPSVLGVVAVTTDKVYAQPEGTAVFSEEDRLGGHDPYAASKAAAEMAIDGYRQSLPSWQRTLVIDTARGGNIIGGGDFSPHRLIPDYVRAVIGNHPLTLRHPKAIRPWQHVLCLVHGYLLLIDRILSTTPVTPMEPLGSAWNFGPSEADSITVSAVLETLGRQWRPVRLQKEATRLHESLTLMISSAKARQQLGWRPALTLTEAIALTAEWYGVWSANPSGLADLTHRQIGHYFAKAEFAASDR
jgi:CDP-glucose 4,6-dehydratase